MQCVRDGRNVGVGVGRVGDVQHSITPIGRVMLERDMRKTDRKNTSVEMILKGKE